MIRKAKAISSAFTLADIINELHDELDVRGVSHRGFFASITDFQSYYNANMDLIDIKAAQTLFDPEWPIYTRTNDSCPRFATLSFPTAVRWREPLRIPFSVVAALFTRMP